VLAAIISGLPILIVEGEKDVHAAESIGCVATCNAMGADTGSGTKWLPEFADYFIGADVIIIPDQDVPGEKHAHHVAKTLSNKARSIRIANPPVLCKDLADWVERGANLTEIESHAELIYAEEEIPRKNIFTHVGDPFQSMKPIDWLVKDYFEHDSLTQLFGEPGSGKSFIALSLACCVATGTPWFGKEVKQGAVFYICGEGHAGLLRRFGAWSKEMGVALDTAPIYKSDHQVSLSERDNAKYLLEDIMMIDTVARNFGPADENSTKDMSNFIENVDRYVRIPFKANVLLVHHSGHAGGRARGSSALKAALDSEYMVNKDEDFVTLTPTKMKDAELPTSLTLQFKKVELGEYDGESVSSAVLISLVDTPNLRIGSKLNGDGIHVVDCLNYIYQGWESSEDAKNKLSCSSKTLTECMEKLTSRHLVYKNVVGKYELSTSGHSLLTTTGINLVPKIDNYHFKGSTD
jgi:5S rRNA maturation endonuclease (ribonuclease M5)